MIDLTQLVGLGSVPVVIALIQWVKAMLGKDCPKWLLPLLSVAFGIALNVVLAYLLQQAYGPAAFMGLIAGLAAGGFYSGTKAIKEARRG